MIYQLVNYIRTELPAETIYSNIIIRRSTQTSIPDRYAIISESGGIVQETNSRFILQTIQAITADKSITGARALAYLIYDKIKLSYGKVFATVTVDSEVFPQFQVLQVSAIQKPFNLGQDSQSGLFEYSTNYEVYYSED